METPVTASRAALPRPSSRPSTASWPNPAKTRANTWWHAPRRRVASVRVGDRSQLLRAVVPALGAGATPLCGHRL